MTSPAHSDSLGAPFHVVQIGVDEALLAPPSQNEAIDRQRYYAGLLESAIPGARMTILVLTPRKDAAPADYDNLSIQPVAGKLRGRLKLHGALQRLHRARAISVIASQHCHDDAWIALLFGRRNKVPVIGQLHIDCFNSHVRRTEFHQPVIGRLRYSCMLQGLRYFDYLRVVGTGIERELRRRGVTDDVCTVPVMMSMVADATPVGEPRRPEVLFVGRLCDQKNLSFWLKVARRVSTRIDAAQFTLVGSGALRTRLEAEARQLGLGEKVHFVGAVPYNQLGHYYTRAAAFLLTSHYEGFGRVLAEAQSWGCPAVAPRITGVEDVIADGETGFLLPEGNEQLFADRVVELLSHPDLRTRMGSAGAARMKRVFAPEKLAREWVAVLTRFHISRPMPEPVVAVR